MVAQNFNFLIGSYKPQFYAWEVVGACDRPRGPRRALLLSVAVAVMFIIQILLPMLFIRRRCGKRSALVPGRPSLAIVETDLQIL